MGRVSLSSSPSPSILRSRSRVKKKPVILKRAMTKKSSGWSSKGWQTRSGWQQCLVSDGGQSSKDQMKRPASHGMWKEVFNVVGDLGSLLRNKKKYLQSVVKKACILNKKFLSWQTNQKLKDRLKKTPEQQQFEDSKLSAS